MTIEQYYGERITDPDWKEWRDEELWSVREEPDDYEINAVYEKLAQLEDDITAGELIRTPRSKWLLCVWKNTLDNPKYFIYESQPYLIKLDGKWYPAVSEDAPYELSVVVAVYDTEEEANNFLKATNIE